MACRFTELVVDAADPHRIAGFWAEVLGYEITEKGDDWAYIEGGAEGAPGIVFGTVPEPKTVKNRVHIDVNPTDRDRDAEVERIIALGARRIDIGQGEQTWVVLADPEGNEFCVLQTVKP